MTKMPIMFTTILFCVNITALTTGQSNTDIDALNAKLAEAKQALAAAELAISDINSAQDAQGEAIVNGVLNSGTNHADITAVSATKAGKDFVDALSNLSSVLIKQKSGQAVVDKLASSVQSGQAAYDAKETEYNTKSSDKVRLEGEITAKKGEIGQLESEAAAKTQANELIVTTKQGEITKLAKQKKEQEGVLKTKNDALSAKEAELAGLTNQVTQKEQADAPLENSKTTLTTAISTAEDQIEQLETDIDNLNTEITTKTPQVDLEKGALADLNRSKAALESQKATDTQTLGSKQGELATVNQQLATSSGDAGLLADKARLEGEIQKLEADLRKTDADIATKDGEITDKQNDIDALEESIRVATESKGTKSDEKDGLDATVKAKKAELATVTYRLSQAPTLVDLKAQQSSLESDVDDVKGEIVTVQNTIADATRKIGEANTAIDDADNANTAIAQKLATDIGNVNTEITQKEADLKTATDYFNDFAAPDADGNTSQLEVLNYLKLTLENTTKEHNKITAELAEIGTEIATARNDVDTKKTAFTDADPTANTPLAAAASNIFEVEIVDAYTPQMITTMADQLATIQNKKVKVKMLKSKIQALEKEIASIPSARGMRAMFTFQPKSK